MATRCLLPQPCRSHAASPQAPMRKNRASIFWSCCWRLEEKKLSTCVTTPASSRTHSVRSGVSLGIWENLPGAFTSQVQTGPRRGSSAPGSQRLPADPKADYCLGLVKREEAAGYCQGLVKRQGKRPMRPGPKKPAKRGRIEPEQAIGLGPEDLPGLPMGLLQQRLGEPDEAGVQGGGEGGPYGAGGGGGGGGMGPVRKEEEEEGHMGPVHNTQDHPMGPASRERKDPWMMGSVAKKEKLDSYRAAARGSAADDDDKRSRAVVADNSNR
ncbi:hypothetical protein BZA05DRAFT_464232 [Tricharina praecox]|uniref:uncharacterized protein n=1 Tax=Tricharina praecox TaxID=43433 RepID=UPI00221F68C6|nr:uncharacterized protein BZA05DRAFT_464232 [Tricharina praecox]KAI5841705.1 hypothetical protein BZA05DRAFT_464232 [Tricharina praecox]